MDGRKLFVVLVGLFGLLVLGSFQVFGASLWKIWNIPTLQPSFADARIVTASAESYRLGFDPEIENPRDPFGRLFNLPSVWKPLFLTGLNQSHTDLFAGLLIASFFAGLIFFPDRLGLFSAFLLALCAFSPPILLGIERGNVELFVFFLCALSLVFAHRNAPASACLLGAASLLKFHPIFGVTSLLHLGKERFTRYSVRVAAFFSAIALLTFDNFRRVFANTELGFDLSYGLGILPLYIAMVSGSKGYHAVSMLLSYSLAFFIAILGIHWAIRPEKKLAAEHSRSLSGFRLGAGIYIGTFLLGNNWDYRIMFLLLVLPQLYEWAQFDKPARFTLLATLVSFAYLWISMFLPFAFFLDELANWLVFAGLLHLLIASSPDWARNEIRLFFERHKRQPA